MSLKYFDKEPEKYIKKFKILKNGKEREIISYTNDAYGYDYRFFHEKLLVKLYNSSYKSSMHSYAYKEGCSTKDAFKDHLKSNFFIKLDIKSFFESIHYDNFIKLVPNKITKDINDLKYCFYEDHIPLGFVSSPFLSDIYMNSFDKAVEKYLNSHKTLHYSRYCDDMLISSEDSDFGSLHTFINFIEVELSKLHLTLNLKKKKEVWLEKAGSISFLGLNLSKNNNKSQITVSKKFILKTLDLLEYYYNKSNSMKKSNKNNFLNKIKSRISYIKYNSSISYNRFMKKYKNRFNEDFKEDTINNFK